MAVTQIVDLETEVLPFLGMTSLPADGGAKLQQYIDGLTPVIEDVVGHVVQVTIGPEYYDGGDTTIFLRHTPVLSITSMTEVIGFVPYNLTLQPVGQPVDNFGYTIDNAYSGLITRRSAGSQPFQFWDNKGNVSVTYVAGMAAVPGNVKLATLTLLKLHYQPEQEGFGEVSAFVPSIAHDEDDPPVATPSGYLIPRSVYQMLAPTAKPVMFA